MTLRLFVDMPLATGVVLDLPPGAARHVQVRRLQPGDGLVLFDGRGGEWRAQVSRIGRQTVAVSVQDHVANDREPAQRVILAVGMPANERMDWLVEKATELGVAAVQPLMTERSVLRLAGERATRKQAHWQAVAVAAAEQSGRTAVPTVHLPMTLSDWWAGHRNGLHGWVLSLPDAEAPDRHASPAGAPPADGLTTVLSGPEGGLTADEQRQALTQGLRRWSLGPRVLRAETAPLAALVLLTLRPV